MVCLASKIFFKVRKTVLQFVVRVIDGFRDTHAHISPSFFLAFDGIANRPSEDHFRKLIKIMSL